jgi:aminoglycoside phosphotransferase
MLAQLLNGPVKEGRFKRSPKSLRGRYEVVPPAVVVSALTDYVENCEWNVEPVTDGYGSVVYRANAVGHQALIVKIGIFNNTHPPLYDFIYSKLLLERVANVHLPVPVVLDITGRIIRFPLYIMQALPGSSLLSLYERGVGPDPISALSQVGKAIAALHAPFFRCSGFGQMQKETVETILSDHHPSVLRASSEEPNDFYGNGPNQWINTKEVASLLGTSVRSNIRRLFNSQLPTGIDVGLLHGDLSLRNFLFEDDVLSGVIDGSATVGWLEEDVAGCCVFIWQQAKRMGIQATFLVNLFVNAYTKSTPRGISLECVKCLAIRKAVSRILTCVELDDFEGACMASELATTMLNIVGTHGDPIF